MGILECMEQLALRKVKYYYTDFSKHDVIMYGRMYPETEFIWVVREHGTHIIGIPSRLHGVATQTDNKRIERIRDNALCIIDHYTTSYNDRADFYYVKKDVRISKIKATQARKIVELID